MKYLLCILKEHNNFSYLWKFKPNMPNSFGEIIFEKFLYRMFELINCFATQQFRSFVLMLFPLLLVAISWNLQKMPKLICPVTFKPIMYVRRRLLWAKWNKDSLKWHVVFSYQTTWCYVKIRNLFRIWHVLEIVSLLLTHVLAWNGMYGISKQYHKVTVHFLRGGGGGGLKKLHAPPLS